MKNVDRVWNVAFASGAPQTPIACVHVLAMTIPTHDISGAAND
jgi:hypothetical protein